MSTSARARRMARNHRRLSQHARLSLVSLMDIFTILVFFLMLNSGDVEVLEADKAISLPESVAEQNPEIALTVKVTGAELLVGGRVVQSIESAMRQPGNEITALRTELDYQSERAAALTESERRMGRQLIIMADQAMPYGLLKKIMSTCAASDYRDISLAVESAPVPVESLQLASGVKS
jgi:biopolymer transport protein ExbD